MAEPQPLAPASAPALKDLGGRQWKPTAKQRAYLECWLDPAKPKSVSGICREVGIRRSVFYAWQVHGAFKDWFDQECKAETEHLWPALLVRLSQLALQGSVEHAKLLALIRGAIRSEQPNAGNGAHGGVTVVIGVPRAGDPVSIPEDSSMPSLPAPAWSESEQ